MFTLHAHGHTHTDVEVTIKQLTLLKFSSGKKVEVIKKVAAQWKELGYLFDFDAAGDALDLIAKKHPFDPIACCTEMMKEWIMGRGRQPATWATLIALLKDAELYVLAKDLKEVVLQ